MSIEVSGLLYKALVLLLVLIGAFFLTKIIAWAAKKYEDEAK